MPQNFYNRDTATLYDAIHSSTRRLGIIQENMDNLFTVGYKSVNPDSVLFSQMMKDMFRDEEQGELIKTDRKLDFALSDSNAFFLVEGKDGPERTRDGSFHISSEGKLVNFEGKELVVLDQDKNPGLLSRISESNDLFVDYRGNLFLDGKLAGRIALDYHSRKPGQVSRIIQGRLEASNVDLSQNIVKIMEIKRHIENLEGAMAMEMVMDKSLVETYGRNV